MASTDALTEFAGQRLLTAEEADAPGARAAAVVIGDAPGGVHVRQPQPRVPARPRRRRAHRDAPQPVVADAGRPDARLGRPRDRPRVRDRAAGPDPRQAVRRVLPRGAGRAGAATSARRADDGSSGTTSRWSATTSGPTSRPPGGSGSAAVLVLTGKHGLDDVAAAARPAAARPDAHRRRPSGGGRRARLSRSLRLHWKVTGPRSARRITKPGAPRCRPRRSRA